MAGLLWASMFHYHGYRDVTISEVSENRKAMAATLDLGFSVKHPNDVNEQCEKAVEEKDETWGFDVIIDCTGKLLYYITAPFLKTLVILGLILRIKSLSYFKLFANIHSLFFFIFLCYCVCY